MNSPIKYGKCIFCQRHGTLEQVRGGVYYCTEENRTIKVDELDSGTRRSFLEGVYNA